MSGRFGVALFTAMLAASLTGRDAHGQTSSPSRFHGTPVDVQISDLAQNPGSYYDTLVRTHGRLNMDGGIGRIYTLQDQFGNSVRIVPYGDIAQAFDNTAQRIIGREMEIVGLFQRTSVNPADVQQMGLAVEGAIEFIEFNGPPEDRKGPLKAPEVRLERLLSPPGRHDGQLITVVGKFRGRNLYGDLPAKSERRSADWVIKDDVYAVWVTGRKPKGSGWDLDSSLKRDTGKWIKVIGTPETTGGVTYLKAERVELTTPPTANAEAQPPPPPPERPKVPPVVVFTLPLDGDREVPSDSRFVVQFSKDMDESSFEGHVLVRYKGPRLPGDREFDGVRLSYDGGRRALTVDPGDVLRTGRHLEVVLLPGILDIDGLTLEPRPGTPPLQGVVDVVSYEIGS